VLGFQILKDKNSICQQYMGATCFDPYMVIIRPSLETSQWMLHACLDPNYAYKQQKCNTSDNWIM